MKYSKGFKRNVVRKLLKPNPPTVQESLYVNIDVA